MFSLGSCIHKTWKFSLIYYCLLYIVGGLLKADVCGYILYVCVNKLMHFFLKAER